MTTPDIAAVMHAAMDAEDRRRELASASPGCGALLGLPDNSVGLAVGKAGLLSTVGEGHSVAAEVSAVVHKSYGPDRPQYADPVVGGQGYRPGNMSVVLRSLGERVFGAQDAAAAVGVVELVSPEAAPRRGLLGRLFGRRRSR